MKKYDDLHSEDQVFLFDDNDTRIIGSPTRETIAFDPGLDTNLSVDDYGDRINLSPGMEGPLSTETGVINRLNLAGHDQEIDISFDARVIGTGAKETINIAPETNLFFTAGNDDQVNLPGNLEDYTITSQGIQIIFEDGDGYQVILSVNGTSTVGFANGNAVLSMSFSDAPPAIILGGAVVPNDGITPLNPEEVELDMRAADFHITFLESVEAEAGSTVEVTVTIENVGEASGTQDVFLHAGDLGEVDSLTLELDPGQEETVTFSFDTHGMDEGAYDLSVFTENDAHTESDGLIVTLPPDIMSLFYHMPRNLDEGQEVTFDAGFSYSGEGDIVAYNWDFGDGTNERVFSSRIDHAFGEEGSYEIRLTVEDEHGHEDEFAYTVEVFPNLEEALRANFMWEPGIPEAEEAVTFSAYPSQGDDIQLYEWDFGDGNRLTTEDPVVEHTYSSSGFYDAGMFEVSLTITDALGQENQATSEIRVLTPGMLEAATSSEAQPAQAGMQAVDVTTMQTPQAHAGGDFAGGDGTRDNPYQIADWHHLNNVRDYLGSHFVVENDLGRSTPGYREHVAEPDAGWEPIGDRSAPFRGSFDGQGNYIYGLDINRPDENAVGLFGISNGDIAHLRLQEVNVVGRSAPSTWGDGGVGGLAGGVGNNISVHDVSVEGTIIGLGNGYNVAGVIGETSSSGALLDEVIFRGTVQADEGVSQVGGIMGRTTYSTHIETSYAHADVSGGHRVGGLVGDSSIVRSTFSEMYFTGTVNGISNVGAVVGYVRNGQDIFHDSVYWNMDRHEEGMGSGPGTFDAVGLPSGQMRGAEAEAYMSGLDFDGRWTLVETGTGGYPIFDWEAEFEPLKVNLNMIHTAVEQGDRLTAEFVATSGHGVNVGWYAVLDASNTPVGSVDGRIPPFPEDNPQRIFTVDTSTLSPGEYSLVVIGQDNASNQDYAREIFEVTDGDEIAPLTVDASLHSTELNQGEPLRLDYLAESGHGLAQGVYVILAEDQHVSNGPINISGQSDSGTRLISTSRLEPGDYTLRFGAQDRNNDIDWADAISFDVSGSEEEFEPVSITISLSATELDPSDVLTIDYEAVSSQGLGRAIYRIRDDQGETVGREIYELSGQEAADEIQIAADSLDPGNYQVRMDVQDQAGESAFSQVEAFSVLAGTEVHGISAEVQAGQSLALTDLFEATPRFEQEASQVVLVDLALNEAGRIYRDGTRVQQSQTVEVDGVEFDVYYTVLNDFDELESFTYEAYQDGLDALGIMGVRNGETLDTAVADISIHEPGQPEAHIPSATHHSTENGEGVSIPFNLIQALFIPEPGIHSLSEDLSVAPGGELKVSFVAASPHGLDRAAALIRDTEVPPETDMFSGEGGWHRGEFVFDIPDDFEPGEYEIDLRLLDNHGARFDGQLPFTVTWFDRFEVDIDGEGVVGDIISADTAFRLPPEAQDQDIKVLLTFCTQPPGRDGEDIWSSTTWQYELGFFSEDDGLYSGELRLSTEFLDVWSGTQRVALDVQLQGEWDRYSVAQTEPIELELAPAMPGDEVSVNIGDQYWNQNDFLEWVVNTRNTPGVEDLPFAGVGHIISEPDFWDGSFNYGTGFMITDRHFLTNAHVLRDPEDNYTFQLSRNGEEATKIEVDNIYQQLGQHDWINEPSGNQGWPDGDIALGTLADPIDHSFTSFSLFSNEQDEDSDISNEHVYWTGYPSRYIDQGEDHFYQWKAAGTVESYRDSGALNLSGELLGSQGASGSPVYRKVYDDQNEVRYEVVGIWSGGFPSIPEQHIYDNDGTRIYERIEADAPETEIDLGFLEAQFGGINFETVSFLTINSLIGEGRALHEGDPIYEFNVSWHEDSFWTDPEIGDLNDLEDYMRDKGVDRVTADDQFVDNDEDLLYQWNDEDERLYQWNDEVNKPLDSNYLYRIITVINNWTGGEKEAETLRGAYDAFISFLEDDNNAVPYELSHPVANAIDPATYNWVIETIGTYENYDEDSIGSFA